MRYIISNVHNKMKFIIGLIVWSLFIGIIILLNGKVYGHNNYTSLISNTVSNSIYLDGDKESIQSIEDKAFARETIKISYDEINKIIAIYSNEKIYFYMFDNKDKFARTIKKIIEDYNKQQTMTRNILKTIQIASIVIIVLGIITAGIIIFKSRKDSGEQFNSDIDT